MLKEALYYVIQMKGKNCMLIKLWPGIILDFFGNISSTLNLYAFLPTHH